MMHVTAVEAVKAVVEAMASALSKGEDITLHGLGSFRIKERAEKTARNLQTGEMIRVPKAKVVKFVVSQEIKDTLNP